MDVVKPSPPGTPSGNGVGASRRGRSRAAVPRQPGVGSVADSARTALVISDDDALGVSIADRVDSVYVLVRSVRPVDAIEGARACAPWPWMIVGDVTELPGELLELVRQRPILILWKGTVPSGMPRHVRSFDRWGPLLDEVEAAGHRTLGGLRLDIETGVRLPDGSHVRSASLEALVAAHPQPWDLPHHVFAPALRTLANHGYQWRVRVSSGLVSVDTAEEVPDASQS